MIGRIHLVCILSIGFSVCASVTADSEKSGTLCGQELTARDVLVLDLRDMVGKPGEAEGYVLERAGEYRLTKPLIQEFRMPFRPSGNPEGVIQGARKQGARKGCDLVLLLDTGPYLGRQRSWKAKTKDHGYALVSIGRITAENP